MLAMSLAFNVPLLPDTATDKAEVTWVTTSPSVESVTCNRDDTPDAV